MRDQSESKEKSHVPAELLSDLKLVLDIIDERERGWPLQLSDSNQPDQLENLIQATDARVAYDIYGLSVLVHRLKRDDRDEVDEKPACYVVPGNGWSITYYLRILVIERRIKDEHYVEEEQDINRVIDKKPWEAQFFEESELNRRDNAGVNQNKRDEEVPV